MLVTNEAVCSHWYGANKKKKLIVGVVGDPVVEEPVDETAVADKTVPDKPSKWLQNPGQL